MVGKEIAKPASVRNGILDYLARHPEASDTLDGIAGWWLTAIDPPPTADALQATLDELTAEGRLARIVMLDGSFLYARNQ